MMRVRVSLRPGQPGTKGLLARYGKRLVCVRYRYDERTKQRVKTVELIVDQTEWDRKSRSADGESLVAVRVGWQEKELQQQVKAAGGKWDRRARVWWLGRGRVESLGLESRIVDGAL